MSPDRVYADYLRDIVDAADKAGEFVQGMDFEAFRADPKTVFAVIRALEVVGEATKNVPDVVRASYPQIPWRKMAGMRDKLAHDYFGVDLEVVWKTVTQVLGALREAVAAVLSEMEKERE